MYLQYAKNFQAIMSKRIFFFAIIHFIVFSSYASDFVFTQINSTEGLSDNQIRHILQLTDGRMVFTTNGNVNIFNGAHFTYIHRPDTAVYQLNNYDGHYRIYKDGDSLLWIKDRFKLMCVSLYQEKYLIDLNKYFAKKGIVDAVDDLFIDDQSQMWVLTSAGLVHVQKSERYNLSLADGKLQDIIAHNNQLFLFFNTGKMVSYDLSTKKRLFEKSAYPIDQYEMFENTSLAIKGEKGIYQLRNGKKGGFFFFNYQNNEWKKILEQDYTLNTLMVDNDKTAYISCASGIWIVNLENGKTEYLPVLKTVQGEAISTEISTLFYDKQGGFWVGTRNRGLLYHHPARFRFQYFGRAAFELKNNEELMVQAFAEDAAGNIYIKCMTRYYLLDSQQNKLKFITNTPTEALTRMFQKRTNKNFDNKVYNTLYTDSRGWTWGGTSDGLELFSTRENKKKYHTKDGLSNNFIHALLEDKNGHIWVTTSNGISQISVDSKTDSVTFIRYNQYDGTLKNEYIADAIFESSDGRLFFGGIDGFNILQPNKMNALQLSFSPLFSAFRLYGQLVKPGEKYNNRVVLQHTTPYTTHIELSHFQNFLTFEFSALNFRNPAQTFYRYQMEGIDAQWQEISDGRKSDKNDLDGILRLSYTNMSPGNYRLKVMATDNSQIWNNVVTEISISILPPWWKTTFAYILYILFSAIIIGLMLLLYSRYTKSKMERQHKEDILLLRIRNLIDQCSQYEAAQCNESLSAAGKIICFDNNQPDEDIEDNAEDKIFITRAMEFVEKNLNNQQYSVEQLSRDLCLERTGLYRKLILLLDQSPSLFIRNIRLQRASQLILENKLSITQISELVGFSSTSYMSKCFQEMYGCRPSEYASKLKQST